MKNLTEVPFLSELGLSSIDQRLCLFTFYNSAILSNVAVERSISKRIFGAKRSTCQMSTLRGWCSWRMHVRATEKEQKDKPESVLNSGVTRVGVTRSGNWGCHPYFCEKNSRPFSVITVRLSVCQFFLHCRPYLCSPKKATTFFAHYCHFYWLHSGVTQSVTPGWCHPAPFSSVRPRLPTILCKFTHKKNFPSGVTPSMVSPEAVPL